MSILSIARSFIIAHNSKLLLFFGSMLFLSGFLPASVLATLGGYWTVVTGTYVPAVWAYCTSLATFTGGVWSSTLAGTAIIAVSARAQLMWVWLQAKTAYYARHAMVAAQEAFSTSKAIIEFVTSFIKESWADILLVVSGSYILYKEFYLKDRKKSLEAMKEGNIDWMFASFMSVVGIMAGVSSNTDSSVSDAISAMKSATWVKTVFSSCFGVAKDLLTDPELTDLQKQKLSAEIKNLHSKTEHYTIKAEQDQSLIARPRQTMGVGFVRESGAHSQEHSEEEEIHLADSREQRREAWDDLDPSAPWNAVKQEESVADWFNVLKSKVDDVHGRYPILITGLAAGVVSYRGLILTSEFIKVFNRMSSDKQRRLAIVVLGCLIGFFFWWFMVRRDVTLRRRTYREAEKEATGEEEVLRKEQRLLAQAARKKAEEEIQKRLKALDKFVSAQGPDYWSEKKRLLHERGEKTGWGDVNASIEEDFERARNRKGSGYYRGEDASLEAIPVISWVLTWLPDSVKFYLPQFLLTERDQLIIKIREKVALASGGEASFPDEDEDTLDGQEIGEIDFSEYNLEAKLINVQQKMTIAQEINNLKQELIELTGVCPKLSLPAALEHASKQKRARWLRDEFSRLVKLARVQRASRAPYVAATPAKKESLPEGKQEEAILPDKPISPRSLLDVHPVILNAADDTSFRGCFVINDRLFTCRHPDGKVGVKYRVCLLKGGEILRPTVATYTVKEVWDDLDICELDYKPGQTWKVDGVDYRFQSYRVGKRPAMMQVVAVPFVPQRSPVNFKHSFVETGPVVAVTDHEFDYKISTVEGASGAGVYDQGEKTIMGWHLKGDAIQGNTGRWFTQDVKKRLRLSGVKPSVN